MKKKTICERYNLKNACEKKIWLFKYFFRYCLPVHLLTKLIYKKKQKSSQKSHRSWTLDPCNPNFFHDKSEIEVRF